LLVDREVERARLERLVEAARQGRSAALVVHGEAGMGKTALLRDAGERAAGVQQPRARGIETESHLPFAGLSELLSPLLDLRAEIPAVQAQALGGALALEDAPVADRFAVAAGVLSLLGAAAERRPVLALVDDLQWLDEASSEALLFAARRLDAEGVVMLFGAREGEGLDPGALGLETLRIDGLDDASALALLEAAGESLAPQVAAKLVATAAEPMPDPAVAQVLQEAAVDARGRAAFATAARGFARAAELFVDDEQRARALLQAAGAATVAGESARALDLAERGAQLATDPLLQADLRVLAARTQLRLGEPVRAGQALVREAERVEGQDPVRAATFLIESAVTHMIDGTVRDMFAIAARVREVSGGAAPGLELLATMLMGEAQIALGETEAGDALLESAEPFLYGSQPVIGPPEVFALAGQASMWAERFERAEAIYDRLIGALRETGAAGGLVYPLASRSHLDFRLGRWPAALADADEAVRLGEETGQESLLAHSLGALATVEAGLGRADAARAHGSRTAALGEAQGAPATSLYGHGALALLELGLGNLEEALHHGLAAERTSAETQADEPGIVRWAPDLIEILWRLGRAGQVEERLAALAQQAERPRHSWARAAVERLRGLMAADDAVDAHFARAIELHEETRQPFETARTQLLHGERLRRARRRADARAPLRSALATFERLGAEPWTERARSELRATGGPTGSAAPAIATDELTAQELQIALQVAQGRTNREVAAALFLSAKTIAYHLGSIYRKLGIRRRTELAAALG
jgi:ATP/maltotriose-dependent transcriptional regulator MalT